MKLKAKQLRHRVSPDSLKFDHTGELTDFTGILGQARATEALKFGLSIKQPGYNLYIGGENKTSRIRFVRNYLADIVNGQQPPGDWIYVNNFDSPLEPRVFNLAAGQGLDLMHEIDRMISALLDTFPSSFENPSYLQHKNLIQKKFDRAYDDAISVVKRSAYDKHIAMYHEVGSITFTPIIDGKVIDENEFASLKQEEIDFFNHQVETLETLLNQSLLELPQWQRDLNDQLRQLRENHIEQALKPIMQPLRQSYPSHTGASLYLAQIHKHLPRIIEEHLTEPQDNTIDNEFKLRKLLENLYHPNIFTTAIGGGAPVVMETNPNHQNLFGRVNYNSDDSAAPFQQITPGALHRANGGYLILEVEKLLTGETTWPALKRMLRDGCIYPEVASNDLQLTVNSALQPEPIPLNLKVILIGPREIYYSLDEYDRDFNELFRAFVDIEDYFDGSKANLMKFAKLLHTRSGNAKIAHLSSAAVARLADYGHRLAEHQQRLTSRIDAIMDIAIEADHLRSHNNHTQINREHIDTAISDRRYRNARLSDLSLKEVLEGTVAISSSGSAAGQINALSILQIGESTFGCPTRITATVHPGNRGVIDIEREVKLGQSVHSKGVMILTGYLCSFYTQDIPLAMSAHIAMEQSYGHIDGDSASLAELCALLSALIKQPIRQDLAITGSINQQGEIQAVGGINEKIECFFELCQARGLTGQQGVIIPATNKINLMLRESVVDAVAQKKFTIYTANTVNDALSILSGVEVGESDHIGKFPHGSLNEKISDRLAYFANLARIVAKPEEDH